MILNPFLEGVTLVVLGMACKVMSAVFKVGLDSAGDVIIGIGVGYFGGHAVAQNQGGK